MIKRSLVVSALFVISTPAFAHSNLIENILEKKSTPEISDLDADTRKEVTCTALAVYYESKGQPVRGQSAVAHVIQNRMTSGKFPTTACGVVFQKWRGRHQFSFLNMRNLMPTIASSWSTAVKVSIDAILKRSVDPTGGAKFFHNPAIAKGRSRGVTIGAHRFTP